MTPRQLAQDAENAYYGHDRDMFLRSLGRLTAMATPPDLAHLTREQLEQRRDALHTQLAAVNEQLRKMNAAGRQTVHLPDTWARSDSLDPSD